MKRIILSLLAIMIGIYAIESSEYFGIGTYKPHMEISHAADQFVISWPRLHYPVYYEVEILNRTPGAKGKAQAGRRIVRYRTFDNIINITDKFPESAYLRVSAHSLFHHPLGSYSDTVGISQLQLTDAKSIKPTVLSHYPAAAPAPNIPVLRWTIIPGAVYYEIEFLDHPPEAPNDIQPSIHRLFSSREVFCNGYTINLSSFSGNHLYWRVRALDYDGNPLGVFSDAEELHIDHSLPQIVKPVANTNYAAAAVPMPLYPVYSWIPLVGAVNYEVEVTSSPPENPNGTAASRYRIRNMTVTAGFDCYDEEPLIVPGTYYWRVRGLDKDGQPVGVYSNAEAFTVDLTTGRYAATLGDSISHGGGAVSYSPADVEYSYQTYLSFPAANLAKSGDTSETMLDRFDADVLPYHPKFLIIMAGSNSLRGGVPATQVITELTAMRDKCLSNGIRPIFLTLPPINPANIYKVFAEETAPEWRKEFTAVNQFIRQQQYYIDLEPYFVDANYELPTRYAIDGLHLDIPGKKLMAQIINANWDRVSH